MGNDFIQGHYSNGIKEIKSLTKMRLNSHLVRLR